MEGAGREEGKRKGGTGIRPYFLLKRASGMTHHVGPGIYVVLEPEFKGDGSLWGGGKGRIVVDKFQRLGDVIIP